MSRRRRVNDRPARSSGPGQVNSSRTVIVSVPVPERIRAGTVQYVSPSPVVRYSRVRRIQLSRSPYRLRVRRVRVRVPVRLPLNRPSYVSIDRGRLNVHSFRQVARVLADEANRRRYEEHKSRHRKARDGQLESVRRDSYGMIADAYARGWSARRIADVAMVSRALGGS